MSNDRICSKCFIDFEHEDLGQVFTKCLKCTIEKIADKYYEDNKEEILAEQEKRKAKIEKDKSLFLERLRRDQTHPIIQMIVKRFKEKKK